MFLTKKNAAYLNKPAKGKVITPRVLPGWGDEDDNNPTYTGEESYEHADTVTINSNNLLDDMESGQIESHNVVKREGGNKKIYYNWDELNALNNIECEKKLVETMVEPGGIRVKPNDNMLIEFAKESKGMDPPILGSLLMSKLQVNYPFQIKAKSLYTIEYLSKKNPSYLSYFKSQTEKLKNFQEPEDNVDNYRKILKGVLNVIGVETSSHANDNENQIEFQDPGYNEMKPAKKSTRKLVSPNESRKTMQGPGEKKKMQGPNSQKNQQVFDIFATESNNKQSKAQSTGLENLLSIDQPMQPAKNSSNNFTFDDLLKGPPQNSSNGKFDFTL